MNVLLFKVIVFIKAILAALGTGGCLPHHQEQIIEEIIDEIIENENLNGPLFKQ